MADVNIFEQASRLKLRFDTFVGYLSVEDLWDADLVGLDKVAIGLHDALQSKSRSFVEDTPKADLKLQLAFDVVKHIIDVKKAERQAAKEAKDRRDQKQKMLAIIARKEEGELEAKSLDELRALVDTL